MKRWQKILVFLGRIFISLLFILGAINKIIDWQESEHALTNYLLDWQSYASFSLVLQNFFSRLMDWIPAVLVFLISLELLGGLLLFFGMKVRLGAFLLVFFLVLSTFLFHPFWFLAGVKKQIEFSVFLRDLAILGGLFYVLSFGSKGTDKSKPKPAPYDSHSGGSGLGSNFPNPDSLNFKSKDAFK